LTFLNLITFFVVKQGTVLLKKENRPRDFELNKKEGAG